jgi:hypothetical protein
MHKCVVSIISLLVDMKSILVFAVLLLLAVVVRADDPHCSFPTDAILVSNQRSNLYQHAG